MSQPVLEPRAGRCVGFGEWAAGGTQVTSVLAVPRGGLQCGAIEYLISDSRTYHESRIHEVLGVSWLSA